MNVVAVSSLIAAVANNRLGEILNTLSTGRLVLARRQSGPSRTQRIELPPDPQILVRVEEKDVGGPKLAYLC